MGESTRAHMVYACECLACVQIGALTHGMLSVGYVSMTVPDWNQTDVRMLPGWYQNDTITLEASHIIALSQYPSRQPTHPMPLTLHGVRWPGMDVAIGVINVTIYFRMLWHSYIVSHGSSFCLSIWQFVADLHEFTLISHKFTSNFG